LSGEKGFPLLIEAVERCVERGLDLDCGSRRRRHAGRSAAQIAASRHAARLQLLGFAPTRARCSEALRRVRALSLREGLPNVVLEAMAMRGARAGDALRRHAGLRTRRQDAAAVDVGSSAALDAGLERLAQDATARRAWRSRRARAIERDDSFARACSASSARLREIDGPAALDLARSASSIARASASRRPTPSAAASAPRSSCSGERSRSPARARRPA
jgi:hypothetical protein